MNIDVRQIEGVTVLDIDGRIIGPERLALKNMIDEEISSAEDGEVKMLLNMKHVRAMDSSGLGIVIAAYSSVQRKGGRIALLNISGSINSLIVMSKLLTIFDRYDDEEEAIRSFQEG
ncbi:MAG: STAS domain-containing protein [Candidatus Poribacteria bacterium]|nr:STAS domain-containing protein [Candidatus Poribacteria bacterium]